ncbi:MAG: CDP-alcohol phosphatidyltransferase family protein [Sphingomonadales bacterium]|nr:CDP-alcohol phosphatidyltransferase family protein [Sphingomonadales bacterium]
MTTPDQSGVAGRTNPIINLCRPRELEDALNFYIYHPIALRLATALKPSGVSPNAVSVAGGAMVLLAAGLYSTNLWPYAIFLALLCHISWHILDGTDGDLARMTGRSSAMGELIDGLSDYISHIALYLLLIIMLGRLIGTEGYVLGICAGLSRIVQANHYEVQRRQYQYWVYGTAWLRTPVQQSVSLNFIMRSLAYIYLFLGKILAPGAAKIEACIDRAASDITHIEANRQVIKCAYLPVLKGLSPLGANYRTLVLGASMLAGSPVYFFLYEAIVLNVILARSIWKCRNTAIKIVAKID